MIRPPPRRKGRPSSQPFQRNALVFVGRLSPAVLDGADLAELVGAPDHRSALRAVRLELSGSGIDARLLGRPGCLVVVVVVMLVMVVVMLVVHVGRPQGT